MSKLHSPYVYGLASKKIVDLIKNIKSEVATIGLEYIELPMANHEKFIIYWKNKNKCVEF